MPTVCVVVEDSLGELGLSFYYVGLGFFPEPPHWLEGGVFRGLWYDCLPGRAQRTEGHTCEGWAESVELKLVRKNMRAPNPKETIFQLWV